MARDVDGIIQEKFAALGDADLGDLVIAEGWPLAYSTPGGKDPQRLQFNQLYRFLYALGKEINQDGPYLDYSSILAYNIGAVVVASNGWKYRSKTDANLNNNPLTDSVNWGAEPGDVSSAFALTQIQNPTDGMAVSTNSFYANVGVILGSGGNSYFWKANQDKATATGGSIVDPTALNGWDGTQATIDTTFHDPTNGQGSGVGLGCWIVIASQFNARMFGAVGAGGSEDDTVSSQAAITSGLDILWPQGKYRITDTLIVTKTDQSLTGPSGSVAPEFSSNGALLQFDIGDGDPATEMFLVRSTQVCFSNLMFGGDVGNTNDLAIKFEKNDGNNDDVDGYVADCSFLNWDIGIYIYGRALNADHNIFSAVVHGIIMDWPASGTSGPAIQTDDLYKGRAHRIVNNRFHGGTACTVTNYLQRGAIYSNNSIDIGNRLLLVTGGTDTGLYGCVIVGNVVDICSLSCVKFEEGTICRDVTFTANKFGGVIAGTIPDTGDKRPFACMQFDSISEITGLIINANTFTATDAKCITFQNDQAAGAIIPKQVVITNNTFREIGLDGAANRSIVSSVYDLEDFTFSTNMIADEGATVTRIIDCTGQTITNPVIRANTYDPAKTLFIGTLAGNISVEHTQGVYGSLPTGQFQLGDLGGYSSTLPLILSRTTSSGGVGTRHINSVGYIDLSAAATGANTGQVLPGGDNSIDCGSGALRWQTIFAGTGTINTSDEREKTELLAVEDVEKQVALELKASIRKFKFTDAVESKGDKARIHFGIGAQTVADIFSKHGLGAADYGLFCHDEWGEGEDTDGNATEAGDRYGIRYSELLAFIMSAM